MASINFTVLSNRNAKIILRKTKKDFVICYKCHNKILTNDKIVTRSNPNEYRVFHQDCYESLYIDLP